MTPCLTTGPRAAVVRFVFTALLFLSADWARAQDAILQPAPSRVDVVALMVEFQPDTTRFTTGNGTFNGSLFPGVDAPKIDPLPHNAAYFDAHLRFLEHYVGRVSDGKTRVTAHLLPEVVRVSKPMGAYSPTGHEAGSDAELTKLSALVKEAWTLADQSTMILPSGLDPATTAFVIFHAGVGRDIELVGTTLDKTPEDLPSIFFGSDTLQRLGANGISMDGFPISNSLIIPRTESRMGVNPLTQEPFLVELSINGMLAASFFNWLGVPDLFNTETGESAIGPFGLMDALGIFAYSGLFPPEPSAWTKQFLGWGTLASADAQTGEVSLLHSGHLGLNHMARIAISGSEYYLVENRHRDPDQDGVRMQVWTHEGEHEVVFPNGDPEFNDRTVEGFPGGVIVAVDDYDFALPGGVDENDNPLLGGILIWHIDENRLAASLADNRVNADPEARAIDLEEADGAQDIGFGTGGGFFSANFDLGTPFDFWYEGNPVTVRTSSGQDIRLYQNRFAADTHPSSDNNAGGPSGVVLSDFSLPDLAMTFTVQTGDTGELNRLEDGYLPWAWIRQPVRQGILVPNPRTDDVWTWHDNHWVGPWWCSNSTAPIQPVFRDGDVYSITDQGFFRETDNPLSQDCIPQPLLSFPAGTRTWTTPRIEWNRIAGELQFHAGVVDQAGPALLTFVVHDGGTTDQIRQSLPEPARFLFVEGRNSPGVLIVTESGVLEAEGGMVVSTDLQGIKEAAMSGSTTDWSMAWTGSQDPEVLHILHSDGQRLRIHPEGACEPAFPTWKDLDGDGVLDVAFACGSTLQAFHTSGALMAGLPLLLGASTMAQPVFGTDANGRTTVLARTAAGYVEGYRLSDSGWDRIEGFPLSAGSPIGVAPMLAGNVLTVLETDGTLRRWGFEVSNSTRIEDAGLMVSRPDRGAGDPEGSRLLVASETYNWPNPIRSGQTRIRFEVQETSHVEIDIVDTSGMRVDHLEVEAAPGGMPTEVVWQTGAGSGVYLARVKARSLSNGRTDTRLIRMAIIR